MKPKRLIAFFLILICIFFSARYYLYKVAYRLDYGDIISKYARIYDVDAYLIMAVIHTESRFKKDAVSSQGAVGLMQIMIPTAEWIAARLGDEDFDADELSDPETNIKMGIWYLHKLREEFGTTELVLAAYNAGPGTVNKWLDANVIASDGKNIEDIPYNETRSYVKKALADEKTYKLLYETLHFLA